MEPQPKRAPTFFAIIGFKVVKGLLFLALALAMYALSDNDLPVELRRLEHSLQVHPGNKFFTEMALKVGTLTESNVLWAAAGTLLYSLFSLVEGVGLLFHISWACWLAIGESAFFIPIELYEIKRKPGWGLVIVLLINIVIVGYLFRNRRRLFTHH